MHKKIIMACMAIAAFAAFVVAPVASAAELTEGGVTVPVGASIKGTSTETKFTAGNNTVTCNHAVMTGTVTHNSENEVFKGTVSGEIPAGNAVFKGTDEKEDCTSNGLGPVKPTVNSKLCLHIAKGSDTGTVNGCSGVVTFTLDVTKLGLECHYELPAVNGKITTEGEGKDAEINVIAGQIAKRHSSSVFCPAEGELDMEFKLTTTDGTTLTFS
jgi:hypothetical protein